MVLRIQKIKKKIHALEEFFPFASSHDYLPTYYCNTSCKALKENKFNSYC